MPILTSLLVCVLAGATPKPRALTDSEAATLQARAGGKYEVDASQSFRVALADFGLVDFAVACSTDETPRCKELLVKDGAVVYSIADPVATAYPTWMCNPEAVAFPDVDRDGKEDLAIVLSCMTGIGPTGAEEFPVGEILFRRGQGFVTDPAVDKAIDTRNPKTLKQLLATARAALHMKARTTK